MDVVAKRDILVCRKSNSVFMPVAKLLPCADILSSGAGTLVSLPGCD